MKPNFAFALLTIAASLAATSPAFAQEPTDQKMPAQIEFTLPGVTPLGPQWAKGATLYQLNLHNFTPQRTIAAAQQELPRLAKSGVDIVWLMPVHPRGEMKPTREFLKANNGASPIPVPAEVRDTKFRGNPYCPRDHTQIDPLLGDFADLKRFTDAAHALKMKVILGWVPNHTSWDAPLITQHTDWYLRDKAGRVQQHGGWEPIARLSYADRDSGLWEYMLEARQKFVEQGGVDGFREDVAARTPLAFWQWMRPRLDPDNKLLMLAEADESELYGPFDMAYDWKLPAIFWQILDGDGTTDLIDAHLKKQAEEIGAGAHYLRYLFNHDQTGATRGHWQGRKVIEQIYGAMGGDTVPMHRDKYGVALPAVQVLNALLPGSHPLIFMGMENGYYGGVPHNRAADFALPPADAAADMSGFYADLSALHRRSDGAMFRRVPASSSPKIYAFEREPSRTERLLVVVNLDKKNAQTVELPVGRAQGLTDVSPRLPGDVGADTKVADSFVLPPGGFRVLATPQAK